MVNRNRDELERQISPFSIMDRAIGDAPPGAVIPDNALVLGDDNSMTFGGFTLTQIGLVAADTTTREQWDALGLVLQRLEGHLQWIIGDWCVHAERQWGLTYEQVAAITKREKNTLYQYSWVARSVEFSLRREKLTFGHHKLVAGMEARLQEEWLTWASENSITISHMSRAIQQALKTDAPALSEAVTMPEAVEQPWNRLKTLRLEGSMDGITRKRRLEDVRKAEEWLATVKRWLQG